MPRHTYHHGDLKQALLTAAERLLEDNGAAGITLRQVAKAAGVSHTAPYRHFEDKHGLLASLAQIGYQRLADATQACIAKAKDDPLQQLRLAAQAYVRLATRHSKMTYLMFGGLLAPFDRDPALVQASNSAFDSLLQIIRNGQAAGLYKDKDSQTLAIAAWSQVHGLSMLITGKHLGTLTDAELKRVTQEMVDLLYSGLKAV